MWMILLTVSIILVIVLILDKDYYERDRAITLAILSAIFLFASLGTYHY